MVAAIVLLAGCGVLAALFLLYVVIGGTAVVLFG